MLAFQQLHSQSIRRFRALLWLWKVRIQQVAEIDGQDAGLAKDTDCAALLAEAGFGRKMSPTEALQHLQEPVRPWLF
jgi:hypothetical protein